MKRWARALYQPGIPLGQDGKRVTGSKEHIALSKEAAKEGMVLVKNENKVLPLAKGTRVALFGKGTFDYVKGGGGSGDVTCEDIRMLYGEHSAMYRELELIRRGMILNITLEELISDLADRSGIEEIEQFSAILNIAKRGGGNVTQIIRTTAEVISNKVETMQEMLTMLQGRRLEQNVMEIMPFGISLYIAAAYPNSST